MSQIASGVLKHNRVRPGRPKPLGAGSAVGSSRPRAAARIVEQDAASALVEITCACGSVIRLRCALADPPSGAPAAP